LTAMRFIGEKSVFFYPFFFRLISENLRSIKFLNGTLNSSIYLFRAC